jgi:enamine deaminase RidA (YjgF/YER057c/UK114 family)
MKNTLLIVAILCSSAALSQDDSSMVRYFNPSSLAKPNGYSHAVAVDLGNATMVILSGQVALDSEGRLVGEGDIGKQTEQVFLNIKGIINHAGGTMNDIVKLSYFMLDVSGVQKVRDVRDKFINVKTPPVSTLVQVSGLFRKDMLIEIEATVIIPKQKQ